MRLKRSHPGTKEFKWPRDSNPGFRKLVIKFIKTGMLGEKKRLRVMLC